MGVYRETIHLRGAPYARGLDHGKRLRHRIRAFYTQVLSTALLPNLNREQPSIAGFLTHYQGDAYADGKFSYQLLLEMAQSVETQLPEHYKEEMRGIADGCGLSYDQILLLNTFPDTVLAVRAIAATLRYSGGPSLVRWEVKGLKNAKGEPAKEKKYNALATAQAVEIPTDAQIRLVLSDADGVDPKTVRVQLNSTLYVHGDAGLAMKQLTTKEGEPKELEVILTPTEPLAAASVQAVMISAADTTILADPPPAHARFGRPETLTFTTKGYGKKAAEVPNKGIDDGRTRPPPIAFAVKGSATKDGAPILAQHFALLDAGAAHEGTTLFVHHAEEGSGKSDHAYLSWAGLTWGFSGMSKRGVAWACNFSDTLDNAILKDLLGQLTGGLDKAKLTSKGWPIGLAMREISREATDSDAAMTQLVKYQHLMGWVCMVADKDGKLRLAEIDADAEPIDDNLPEGVTVVKWNGSPENSPASNTEDDLRAGVHYVEKTVDVDPLITALATALLGNAGVKVTIDSQRVVSTYFFKSLLVFHTLGTILTEQHGKLDVPAAQAILSDPRLVDKSDSMNAVVFEPATGKIHHAMGAVPATDAPWETFSFADGGQ
ncbi:MAG: hypothetical protein KC502_06700 [Myxococcales bacterium]|nr:hypothetical protein [Myxococcales bacterium]